MGICNSSNAESKQIIPKPKKSESPFTIIDAQQQKLKRERERIRGSVILKEVQKQIEPESLKKLEKNYANIEYSPDDNSPIFVPGCYGALQRRNLKSYMQDRVFANERLLIPTDTPSGAEKIGLYAVYDGHGGDIVAQYLEDNVPDLLCAIPKCLDDLPSSLKTLYDTVDANLFEKYGKEADAEGSTSTIVILHKDKIHCAWVGDSRAVLSRGGVAKDLSYDHKPNSPPERERLERAGGWVGDGNTVCNIIAVSRAMGDFMFKQHKNDHLTQLKCRKEQFSEDLVSGKCEVRTLDANRELDQFLIIASDGIWDEINGQEAVNFVLESLRNGVKMEKILEDLFQQAVDLKSKDNCGIVIVILNPDAIFCEPRNNENKLEPPATDS